MNAKPRFVGFMALAVLGLMVLSPAFGTGTQEVAEREQVTLRFSWWGGESRHDAMLDMLDIFMEDNPHIRVEAEFSGFSGYRDRLVAQAAADNQPDVFVSGHIGPWSVVPWSARADLRDFDIDLTQYEEFLESFYDPDGRLIGVPYTVEVGSVYLVNETLLTELGLELPSRFWTWDDFAELAQSVYDASGGEVYGAIDETGGIPYANAGPPAFEMSFFGTTITDPSGLALTEDQLRFTYEWWGQLRETGAVSPADITVQADDGANSPIVNREVAILGIAMGSYSRFQNNTPDNLVMVPTPAGEHTPFTVGVGMSRQLSAVTRHPDEAALLLDFQLNDPRAGARFGTEMGMPANAEFRDLLVEEGLDEDDLVVFEMHNWILDNREVVPGVIAHDRYNEFRDLVRAEQQAMAFGRQSIDQTVQAVIRHARDLGL